MTFARKYIVLRRDGSVPDWPWFVLGARDPAAPRAVRSYATTSKAMGADEQYIENVVDHAKKMDAWRADPCPQQLNIDAADVVVIARGLMSNLSDVERTEVFNRLRASWCERCGAEVPCECIG